MTLETAKTVAEPAIIRRSSAIGTPSQRAPPSPAHGNVDTVQQEATVSGYAVRSTEDDESAGGYFVTGTMKDFMPTW